MEGSNYLDRIKLISGGQTGVDRAMLDLCLDHGRECGGWCPEGRKAEDGSIDLKYPVRELPKASYKKRTAANVRDSDATMILFEGEMKGGTLESFEFVSKEQKPFLLLDLSVMDLDQAASRLLKFLEKFHPGILNVSGPRHSQWPRGYECCYTILSKVFGRNVKTPPAGASGVGVSPKE